jgi:hypothetical protein
MAASIDYITDLASLFQVWSCGMVVVLPYLSQIPTHAQSSLKDLSSIRAIPRFLHPYSQLPGTIFHCSPSKDMYYSENQVRRQQLKKFFFLQLDKNFLMSDPISQ